MEATVVMDPKGHEVFGRTMWDLISEGAYSAPFCVVIIIIIFTLVTLYIYFVAPVWNNLMYKKDDRLALKRKAVDQQIRVLLKMQDCLAFIPLKDVDDLDMVSEVLRKVYGMYHNLPSYTSQPLDNAINDYRDAVRDWDMRIAFPISTEKDQGAVAKATELVRERRSVMINCIKQLKLELIAQRKKLGREIST